MNASIASTVPSDLKFCTNLSARPSGPNKPIVNNDNFGNFYVMVLRTFLFSVWLGSTNLAVSHLLSPLLVALCRRKSTRLTAVVGGLVMPLALLFTSFAFQTREHCKLICLDPFTTHGVFIKASSYTKGEKSAQIFPW